MQLSVVIPCLNESDTIATCVEKARSTVAEIDSESEVIVADNGSDDGSQALAIAAGRLISSKLYGVSFWDPLALALAAAALGICAFAAAMIPASMAASISPMTALRTE